MRLRNDISYSEEEEMEQNVVLKKRKTTDDEEEVALKPKRKKKVNLLKQLIEVSPAEAEQLKNSSVASASKRFMNTDNIDSITLFDFASNNSASCSLPSVDFEPSIDRIIETHASDLERDLLRLCATGRDVYAPIRQGRSPTPLWYTAHVLQGAIDTRNRILKHSNAIRKAREAQAQKTNVDTDDTIPEFRDQGYARPRYLIIVPFRRCAFEIVEFLTRLRFDDDEIKNITDLHRFHRDYGPAPTYEHSAGKPVDFQETFSGNTDDCFRIGVGLAKKSLKLFVDFYHADIIIGSPLGIRLAIGSEEGDADEKEKKKYDFDFLSSIECVILDEADVFLMQNFSHVQFIFEHLNQQPARAHSFTDFSRVRSSFLDGYGKFMRQTIVISSVGCPELKGLLSQHSRNRAGLAVLQQKKANMGTSVHVPLALPQAFHRFDAASVSDLPDARFEAFQSLILPIFRGLTAGNVSSVAVFIPSYFDFVRLRNVLKKEDGSYFVQCSEYTSEKKVSHARALFFHGERKMLLFTERFHYFHRYRIRGIRHLVFYELPFYPHFYSELCNLILTSQDVDSKTELPSTGHSFSVTSLYCQYDTLRLASVVGAARAKSMLAWDGRKKKVHMLVSQ